MIPIMKLTFKVENSIAKTIGVRRIKAKVFQYIFNVMLLATIRDTINPVMEPIVNAIAAPVIPKTGTKLKYRIVRGMFMARFMVIACL